MKLKDLYPPGQLFFDIGTNKGDFTEHLLSCFDPRQVICVEPDAIQCEKIRKRFDHRVVVVNKAGSDLSNNSAEFFYCPEDPGSSTIVPAWKDETRFAEYGKKDGWHYISKKVETITIDDLVKQYGYPNFIKIDAEGSEYPILKGMSFSYSTITWEWVEENVIDVLMSIKYLMTIGYRKFGVCNGDFYSMMPLKLMSGDELIKVMKSVCIPSRKELWGMLFAYPDSDAVIHDFMLENAKKGLMQVDVSPTNCRDCFARENLKIMGSVSQSVNSTDTLWKCIKCNQVWRTNLLVQEWQELSLPHKSHSLSFIPYVKYERESYEKDSHDNGN